MKKKFFAFVLAVLPLMGCGGMIGSVDSTDPIRPVEQFATPPVDYVDPVDLQTRLDVASTAWSNSTAVPDPSWLYNTGLAQWQNNEFVSMSWAWDQSHDVATVRQGDIVAPWWFLSGKKSRAIGYILTDQNGVAIPADRPGIWFMRRLGDFAFTLPESDVKPARVHVVADAEKL